jgi:hypothetical protein
VLSAACVHATERAFRNYFSAVLAICHFLIGASAAF